MRRLYPLALLAVGLTAALAADPPEELAIPGWKLSLQAWTYNRLTLFETIDKTKQLGLAYLECFPGQKISAEITRGFDQNCPEDALKAVEAKLAEAGVKLVAFGVTGIPGDEAGARKLFEFAKRFGLITINAEFGRDVLPLLDKLTEEYGIRVGIHNHPKRDNYELWSPDNVLAMLSDHGPLIGSCADTGHWPRSGLDAKDCLRKLAGRVMSLHFKDLNRDGMHDLPYGTGDFDARGQLAELKLMKFTGPISIEYEWTTDHLDEDVAKCVQWMHAKVAELAAGK